VVSEGGAGAALRSPASWSATADGRAASRQRLWVDPAPPVDVTIPPADRPLAGVRVLDLTRVIAGRVGTRFLAGDGAQVLRIDPPGFVEVPAVVPEVTPGEALLHLGSARLQ
jgi:CoA-transferase family III